MSTLYIIATPIGNLSDITLRALEVLRSVDTIAAEDTRHSQRLLQHYQIHKPLLAYHEHNAGTMTQRLINLLIDGKTLALISDAGTPLISDPGYLLVKAAHMAQIPVVPIPGPCAAIAALSVSGLASDHFVFEGFLPAKSHARTQRLQVLASDNRTLIFYEAPHRLSETLAALTAIFGGQRQACLAKELTKMFETVRQDSLENLQKWLATHPDQAKGEYVVIVAGLPETEQSQIQHTAALELLKMLLPHLPLKKAVQIAAQFTGSAKNLLYTEALTWQNNRLEDSDE